MTDLFSEYKFHPSQLGYIMTEARSKGDPFSETCKKHLIECWVNMRYGRTRNFSTKFMEKGTLAEEDSIDLYSLVKGKYYEKNKTSIDNDFFIGMPDLFEGESILKADVIIDIKTSWDIFTFYEVMLKPINKMYFWQLQAYMDMTGAQTAKLCYCLVNTPLKLMLDEQKKLQWNMAVIDPELDDAYQMAAKEIEKNCIFDDIPPEQRYIEFTVKRDQEAIDEAHQKVIDCRSFLNGIDK